MFRRICNRVWDPSKIDSLRLDVVISLALIGMHFPPSIFDIMTHFLYHLMDKVDICGPVATRWMYPMERYMKTLKTYVRNMARPKVSMAKGYIRDECLGFIIEYLQRFEVVQCRVWDVDEEEGDAREILKGVDMKFVMSSTLWDLAYQYILTNISIMSPWV